MFGDIILGKLIGYNWNFLWNNWAINDKKLKYVVNNVILIFITDTYLIFIYVLEHCLLHA